MLARALILAAVRAGAGQVTTDVLARILAVVRADVPLKEQALQLRTRRRATGVKSPAKRVEPREFDLIPRRISNWNRGFCFHRQMTVKASDYTAKVVRSITPSKTFVGKDDRLSSKKKHNRSRSTSVSVQRF